MSKITSQIFGKFFDKEIVLTTLSDKDTSVSIMNWGATIQNWMVYHSTEKESSVVLGFEDFDLYPKFSPFFGSIVGRVIRDATQEVLVKRGVYWNIEVMDIRWFKNDKPTNKGIRLNMEEAKTLLNILRSELDDGN